MDRLPERSVAKSPFNRCFALNFQALFVFNPKEKERKRDKRTIPLMNNVLKIRMLSCVAVVDSV